VLPAVVGWLSLPVPLARHVRLDQVLSDQTSCCTSCHPRDLPPAAGACMSIPAAGG
jgi:DMSO/TMAO reductase YedYZ molybdopterin-dependent catalytic subunit